MFKTFYKGFSFGNWVTLDDFYRKPSMFSSSTRVSPSTIQQRRSDRLPHPPTKGRQHERGP